MKRDKKTKRISKDALYRVVEVFLGVARFCYSSDGGPHSANPWTGTQILPNTNYKKNPEIAQIKPYNTYRGVIKKYVGGNQILLILGRGLGQILPILRGCPDSFKSPEGGAQILLANIKKPPSPSKDF